MMERKGEVTLIAPSGQTFNLSEAASAVRKSAALGSYGETSYQGASLTDRALASWLPLLTSPDAEILPELDALVARSRDLTRNNGIAAGGIQTLVDNISGAFGLQLVPTPNYRRLGKTKSWADGLARDIHALWVEWADTVDCDAARCLTFAGLTEQVLRSALVAGEGLGVPLWKPKPGRQFATQIQLIEPDRLSNPNLTADTASRRGGIDFDPATGEPLAFWIRNGHPGDVFLATAYVPSSWERIPAETPWGRKRVLHIHDRARTGQSRGKPILAPVLAQFKTADHYSGAELKAAVVNAMIAAFIETPLDAQGIDALFGGADKYLAARGQSAVRLQGGAIIPLFPGEKLQSFAPARPAVAFDGFMSTVLRHIATGLNIPYELLLKDFSKTNYSSARASMLEAWRFFLGRREWISTYWASPVYELWLEEVANARLLDLPGYYENRLAYSRARWIGAGRGWVDPTKEAQAAELRLRLGLSTLQDEAAEQGKNWLELAEQRATEQDVLIRLGLPVPWAVAASAPSAAAAAAPGGKPNPAAPADEQGAPAEDGGDGGGNPDNPGGDPARQGAELEEV